MGNTRSFRWPRDTETHSFSWLAALVTGDAERGSNGVGVTACDSRVVHSRDNRFACRLC